MVVGIAAEASPSVSKTTFTRVPPPHQPPDHLKLPLKIKPRLLLWKEELHADKEQAGGLEGTDGLGVGEVAELEAGDGVVDFEALLPSGGDLHQELLLGSGLSPTAVWRALAQ